MNLFSSSSPSESETPSTYILSDYHIIQKVGQGKDSVVYLAICKRGRLRNREVALKKITTPLMASPSFASPSTNGHSLHQTLHHPAIVSFLATFTNVNVIYHVLEYCANGTLYDHLRTRSPLSEGETRGVIRSLTDALIFLNKNTIVHRDIQPANVLISEDYRIKLSSFRHATQLDSTTSTLSTFCGTIQYASFEMCQGLPYSFPTDVWSLGCLMAYCLSGFPPFKGETQDDILRHISAGRYILPSRLTLEAESLLKSMLQTSPFVRIPASQILSHPFLASRLPVTPLCYPTPMERRKDVLSPTSLTKPWAFDFVNDKKRCTKPTIPSDVGSQHPLVESKPNAGRPPLADIRNTDLRNLLRDELVQVKTTNSVTRRIVSDPLPRQPDDWKFRKHRSRSFSIGKPSSIIHVSTPGSEHPELVEDGNQGSRPPMQDLAPIGTTRPIPLNTCLLTPQTHKVVQGQITVLPSQALLVDFREAERRRGGKGDHVLVIDQSGSTIKVYAAPHLSTPCCLAEPQETFPLGQLPSSYWKHYNDASRLIEQIKQRTPKLILYAQDTKCTLMANSPTADIEILFTNTTASDVPLSRNSEQFPIMRIRLSRKRHLIEIVRLLKGSSGSEWVKKELTEEPGGLAESDWRNLGDMERHGVKRLAEFVRTCEALECMEEQDRSSSPKLASIPTTGDPLVNSRSNGERLVSPAPGSSYTSGPTSTVVKSLASINLVPRPQKLSGSGRSHHSSEPKDAMYSAPDAPEVAGVTCIANADETAIPSWLQEHSELPAGVQTRFIPSVGWCIRYGSRVSQGGRYRIMFTDGIALEIDVDEEWVEYTDQSGNSSRHAIRDCSTKKHIAERIKVFEQFVSMFNEASR